MGQDIASFQRCKGADGLREPGYGNSVAGFGARSSYGWRRARLWGLMASLAAACGEAPGTPTPLGDAGKLSPITSGEIRFLDLHLETGQFFHLEVEQRGIDLIVELKGPTGETLTRVDSLNGAWGPEEVILLVPATGRHRLEVHGPKKAGIAGEMTWEMVASRPPTARDRELVAAEGAFRAGHAERTAGRLAEAASAYRGAWRGFSQLLLPRRQAEALQGLYRAYDQADQYELAASVAERAAEMFESARDHRLAGTLRRSAGHQWLRLGQPNPAIEQLERARERFREVGDSNEMALTLGKLAAAHSQSGRLQMAWSTYELAFEALGDRGNSDVEASLLTDSVALLLDLGQRQRAIAAGERAVTLFRPASRVDQLAPAWVALASAWSEAGQQSSAESAITEALALARSGQDPRLLANVLLQAGMVWWRGGDSPGAEAALSEALPLAREAGDAKTEAEMRLAFGAILTSTGRAQEALVHHGEAERLFRAVGDEKSLASTAARAAEALVALGRPLEAWQRMEPALVEVETLRIATARRDHRSSFFALRQDYFGIALDILLRCHEAEPRRGYDLLAWQVHELRLARELGEARLAGPSSEPGGQRVREQQLTAELSEAALIADPTRRQQRVNALLDELHRVHAEILPRRAGPRAKPAADLARVQRQLLDPESLLLVYALGDRRSVLWAITDESVETFSLPARAEIEGLARDWVEKLRTPGKSGRAVESRRGNELAAHLLAPVEARLGRRRLWIVADGALEGLPWVALPLPSGRKEAEPTTLLHQHTVTTLPSVGILLDRTGRRPEPLGADRQVAVLADAVFTGDDARLPGRQGRAAPPVARSATAEASELERVTVALGLDLLPRLPETGREAEALLALLPTEQGLYLRGFEAQRKRFFALPFARLGVLHLATHALLDASTPELSGIVLSRFDAQGRPIHGFLSAAEIAQLRLPGTLVVLSACESGVGKQLEGEGMLSLMRAFLEAGADGVVATLWPVSDHRTAVLMEAFYRGYLRDGLPAAEALRQAQLTLANDPDYADPYGWAGFFYQGDQRVW